jgi:hypothetical protein
MTGWWIWLEDWWQYSITGQHRSSRCTWSRRPAAPPRPPWPSFALGSTSWSTARHGAPAGTTSPRRSYDAGRNRNPLSQAQPEPGRCCFAWYHRRGHCHRGSGSRYHDPRARAAARREASLPQLDTAVTNYNLAAVTAKRYTDLKNTPGVSLQEVASAGHGEDRLIRPPDPNGNRLVAWGTTLRVLISQRAQIVCLRIVGPDRA